MSDLLHKNESHPNSSNTNVSKEQKNRKRVPAIITAISLFLSGCLPVPVMSRQENNSAIVSPDSESALTAENSLPTAPEKSSDLPENKGLQAGELNWTDLFKVSENGITEFGFGHGVTVESFPPGTQTAENFSASLNDRDNAARLCFGPACDSLQLAQVRDHGITAMQSNDIGVAVTTDETSKGTLVRISITSEDESKQLAFLVPKDTTIIISDPKIISDPN